MNKSAAKEWIAKHRAPQSGKLDMNAMAESLKITISYKDLQQSDKSTLRGLMLYNVRKDSKNYPHAIVIHSNMSKKKQLFTFGHEIGHYFCFTLGMRQQFSLSRNSSLEDFCDWFSEQLIAIPKP